MTTTVDSRKYLSVGEVSHELRMSKASVYRAIESGSLPAVQLVPHGALRIPAGAVQPHSTSSGETTATGGHEEPRAAAKSPPAADKEE